MGKPIFCSFVLVFTVPEASKHTFEIKRDSNPFFVGILCISLSSYVCFNILSPMRFIKVRFGF